jgi:hypothetical protein
MENLWKVQTTGDADYTCYTESMPEAVFTAEVLRDRLNQTCYVFKPAKYEDVHPAWVSRKNVDLEQAEKAANPSPRF